MKPNKIFDNLWLNALAYTMLFSAALHMTIYVIIWVQQKDPRGIEIFNYFDILDLDYYWPSLVNGQGVFIISLIVAAGVYSFFYWFFSKKS